MDDLELTSIAMSAHSALDKAFKVSDPRVKLRLAMEALRHNKDESEELDLTLKDLLGVMREHNASDLHIKEGTPPMVRIYGELFAVGKRKLNPRDCRQLIMSSCTRAHQEILEDGREVDFGFTDGGVRFRVNAYLQKSTFSASVRMLKDSIPGLKELHLPPQIKDLLEYKTGLILVTGPTGSGKTTSMAAIIDYLNRTGSLHIITIEDPIEYFHKDRKSIISQREIGSDTTSFAAALRSALRQDPNVIFIGELRDPETIMVATMAAETGHLVLSTLHTPDTVGAVIRVLEVFQGDNQRQIRLLLAGNLRGVIAQRLVPRADGAGFVPAVEILRVSPTVANLIIEDKLKNIYKYIYEDTIDGMQTMNQSLHMFYKKGIITYEDALGYSDRPNEMKMMLDGHTTGQLLENFEDDTRFI